MALVKGGVFVMVHNFGSERAKTFSPVGAFRAPPTLGERWWFRDADASKAKRYENARLIWSKSACEPRFEESSDK